MYSIIIFRAFAWILFKCFFFFREWISKRREEIRPWTTFVKTTNFEVPASVPKLSKRFYKNIEHFQSNYVSSNTNFEIFRDNVKNLILCREIKKPIPLFGYLFSWNQNSMQFFTKLEKFRQINFKRSQLRNYFLLLINFLREINAT